MAQDRTSVLTTTTAREARRTRETRERRRSGASNAGSGTGQRDGSSGTPSSRSRNTRSSRKSGGDAGTGRLAETRAGVSGRRRLDREGDNVGAPDDSQPQRALLLLLDDLGGRRRAGRRRLVLLALGSAELFRVGEDEVHVLVKGEHLVNAVSATSNSSSWAGGEASTHLTGHLAAVIQGDAHPVVDLLMPMSEYCCNRVRARHRGRGCTYVTGLGMMRLVSALMSTWMPAQQCRRGGEGSSPSCLACLSPTSWQQDATE